MRSITVNNTDIKHENYSSTPSCANTIDQEHYYNDIISLITSTYTNNHINDSDTNNANEQTRDNFSYLVFVLLVWLKHNSEYFSFEATNDKKIRLSISKEVRKNELQVLIDVYQDLTLKTINFWENEITQTWDTYLYF